MVLSWRNDPTLSEKINVRFWPIFVSVKKTDIYFFGKEAVFLSIFVSVKKNGHLSFRKWFRKSGDLFFIWGRKAKTGHFFLWKIQRFLLALKKTNINFFGENQRFLLALKKWTFIFSNEVWIYWVENEIGGGTFFLVETWSPGGGSYCAPTVNCWFSLLWAASKF